MALLTPELDNIIAEGAAAIPTTALWEEIRDLIGSNYGHSGSVVLGSTGGVTVTIPDQNTVEYDVFFFVEKDPAVPDGSTGEIKIEAVSQTSFKVYNSGSDVTSVLYYRVFKR